MEVDNELINELIQNTEALVELTDEQREGLKQSFSMIVGTYLITKNKTNVVILGDDFNVDLVKSHIEKHQDLAPTIGCVGSKEGTNLGMAIQKITEDNTTIKFINRRLDLEPTVFIDDYVKPHQHPHRKRNKFKPNKISHKRRK